MKIEKPMEQVQPMPGKEETYRPIPSADASLERPLRWGTVGVKLSGKCTGDI